MVDSSIVKYVKDTLSKGFKEADIKAALLKQGWQDNEVNEAISIARAEMPGPAIPAAKPQPAQPAKAKPSAQPAKPVKAAQPAKPVQKEEPMQPLKPQGDAKPQPQPKVGVQQPAKPVAQPSAKGWLTGGFILTLIGGIMVIINAVTVYTGFGDMLSLFITNVDISVFTSLGFTFSTMDYLLINLIVGGFLVIVSILIMKMQQKSLITGIFSIVIAVFAILMGNGFMIGGIIGAVGGVLALLKK